MLTRIDREQLLRRALLTGVLLAALVGLGVLLDAAGARLAEQPYELADDLPRGALVYAQFRDLPAMLKTWNESDWKTRYLASTSYQQLQSRHLALKLVSRWKEFNDATGFPIDAAALGGLADNRAAIAVYDIGRLDLVLVAPLSEPGQAASLFFQNKEKFARMPLPDGAVYYLHDVEADRGRQKQQIGFAAVKGRFILATSEKLLQRTIANLNGQAARDRLSDDPAFEQLSRGFAPHALTVWVDQSKLTEDWYFKRYWLTSRPADWKNLRAGIFDLDWQNGRWIERREFLTTGAAALAQPMSAQARQQLAAIVPPDAPFVQVRALGGQADPAAALAADALFDGAPRAAKSRRDVNWQRYGASEFELSSEDDGEEGDRYGYLSYRYNQIVDDPFDTRESSEDEEPALRQAEEQRGLAGLRAALQAAAPEAAARIAKPRAIEGPLFAEFGRASVFALRNPGALDRAGLERAIAQLAVSRTMIAGATATFEWRSRAEDGVEWREMPLPALGRSVGYGVRGNLLLVSNSPTLLGALMRARADARDAFGPAQETTLVRLDQRAEAFDRIFGKLDEPRVKAYWKERKGDQAGPSEPSQEFFSGNLASLLDVASPVRELRIQRSYSAGRLHEEVALLLR